MAFRYRRLGEVDTGAHVKPTRTTVAAFLDRWLKDYVGVNIQKAKTREYYTSIVRTHLRPKLGAILLTKLTATHVQAYYRDAFDGGLSSTSVHGHHRTLHRALACAVKWGLVGRNVCDATEPPKIRRLEMKTWTPVECLRFLDAAKANRYGPVSKDNLTKRDFARLIGAANAPRIRFHDLRHTSANLLLGANVNAKVVSERLGHSSIGITLDTYSHVVPTMQREASDTLGRILSATK